MQAGRKMYSQWTKPAKDFGYEGEKRLKEHFGDDRLELRYHVKNKEVQVWYLAPSSFYCVCVADRPFDIARIIHNLEARQKSGKQQLTEYKAAMAQMEKDKESQFNEMVQPVAEVCRNIAVGRVITS